MQRAAVRAEVPVPLALLYAAGDEHAREFLSGHADPGIGLGVLEEDVVLGLVLLDEVVFQQEGVGLGIHHGKLCVGNLAYQDARLGVQALRRHKVLGHAFVQVLGLAHIDNLPLSVIVAVHAGRMREEGYFLFYGHRVFCTKVVQFCIIKKF